MSDEVERKKEEKNHSETKINPLEIRIFNELQIVQFLDNITEDSFLYLYNKTIPHYRNEIQNFVEQTESGLENIWNENKKELDNILNFTGEIAKQNGIKRSLRKATMIWSIFTYGIILGASFGSYIILGMFFDIPQDLTMIIFMISLVVLCFTNSLVSKVVINKRLKFRAKKTPILKQQMKESLECIKKVNQFIINDIKDIIMENKFDSSRYKAYLYNKNYDNIKVLGTENRHNVPIYNIGIDITD